LATYREALRKNHDVVEEYNNLVPQYNELVAHAASLEKQHEAGQ
jgi:hypothetical protein